MLSPLGSSPTGESLTAGKNEAGSIPARSSFQGNNVCRRGLDSRGNRAEPAVHTPGKRSSKRADVIYGRIGPLQFQEATVSHTKNWPTADRRFLYSLLMVLVFRR